MTERSKCLSYIHDAVIQRVTISKNEFQVEFALNSGVSERWVFQDVLEQAYVGPLEKTVVESVEFKKIKNYQDIKEILDYRDGLQIPFTDVEVELMCDSGYELYIFNNSTRFFMDVICKNLSIQR